MVTLEEVRTARQRSAFIGLLEQVNKGDPCFVHPLQLSEKGYIDVESHPFYAHVDAKFYLAMENGKAIGRIASLYNRALHQGYFGFLQCAPNQAAFDLLLSQVAADLQQHGIQHFTGPVNPSINYEMGVLTEGFNSPPFIMLSHNPPYYDEMIQAAGFQKAKDFHSYYLSRAQIQDVDKIERVRQRLQDRFKVVVRHPNMRRFADELKIVEQMYNDSMEEHWGFVKMSSAEFKHMANDLKQIIDPKMVLIAELEGRPVGFVMALPNINEILIDIRRGRLFPSGIFKLLFLKSRIKGIRVTTIGVVRDCQPLGIGSLLYFRLLESFLKSRYQKVEFSWVMEDNHRVIKMARAIGARPYKTYRMYQNSPTT